MSTVIYVVSGLFIVIALAMTFAYHRTRHYGTLLMGFAYGVSGALAVLVLHWWPLAAGFALVWLLKLLGFEPQAEPKEEGGRMKDEGKT